MRLLKRFRENEVHVLFREIYSGVDDTQGPDRPIVGAVFDESEARNVESTLPGIGFHWQTVRHSRRDGLKNPDVIFLLVENTEIEIDFLSDPQPVRAFGMLIQVDPGVADDTCRRTATRLWKFHQELKAWILRLTDGRFTASS